MAKSSEPWSYRLWLFCHADDLDALTQLAIDVSQSEAEANTFHPVGNGMYGCNTAATDEIRAKLNDGLANLLGSGMVGTVYVARLDNGTDILRASYSASPSGFGSFGGTIDQPWTFTEALETLHTI